MNPATPLMTTAVLFACGFAGWVAMSPPAALVVSGPVVLGATSPSLVQLESSADEIARNAKRTAVELPGYDDVVFLDDGSAIASGMDGWLWRIDREGTLAERWFDAPLMPAGVRRAPDDADLVYFCSAVLHGETYPAGERVGLYSIRVSTREMRAIVVQVPDDPLSPREPTVYSSAGPAATSGSRPLAFCNDVDVSRDGRRLYFSEPFSYAGASMGEGAFPEAISLGSNGRLWRHDLESGETDLVASGFHFLDGVLLEPGPSGAQESSVLITETTRFRIQRLFVGGKLAGRHEILWHDLPGMPDGLDRDAAGNVWVGLLTLRSAVTDWVHANPWIKPLILRLPTAWVPKSKATGVLALTPDAEQALHLMLHDGSVVSDVSVAIPHRDRVVLASFSERQRGLVAIARPTEMMRQ